jgi:predicted Zn-dependent protease
MSLRDELLGIARRRAAGDADAALEALDALGAEHPDDPYLLHARGRARFDRGFLGSGGVADKEAGLELLEAAVERAPADPWLFTELAFAREWGFADAGGAEAAYRRALALEPDFADALLGAAGLHRNPSADVSAEEATAWRQRAARLRPDDGDNWLMLADLHDEGGRAEQAERARARAALAPGAEPDLVAERWPAEH